MGELHLEIYVERMRREYNVECTTGKPRVAYREAITNRANFSYTHKKQTGGAGQFGRVIGWIEPMTMDEETGKDVAFINQIMGTNIPTQYIPACEKVRAVYRSPRSIGMLTLLTGLLRSHHQVDVSVWTGS